MSLQWTAVAILLYTEILILTVFLLPWIRPPLWQKLFRTNMMQTFAKSSRHFGVVVGAILLFLFCDAFTESQKFAMDATLGQNQVKLGRAFRAQRNLFLTGFTVFLAILIKRMANLLIREAELMEDACKAINVARTAADRASERLSFPLTVEDQRNKGQSDLMKDKMDSLQKRIDDCKKERDEIQAASQLLTSEYLELKKRTEGAKQH